MPQLGLFDASNKDYSARAHVAAGFVQGFARTRCLEEAVLARARVKERVSCGVQFAQRTMWGLQLCWKQGPFTGSIPSGPSVLGCPNLREALGVA